MGGKYDPRSGKGGVRPEHNVPDYFDAVVEDAAEWFVPFAHHTVIIGMGNHETSQVARHEFNAVERLVCLLNSKTGSRVYNGSYSGWLVFAFNGHRPNSRSRTITVTANYHHGTSSGKTSSNVLAHERRAAYTPDADILLSGHAHNFWCETVARLRLGQNGVVYQDTQLHLGVPGYKDEIGDGREGWAVEKGFRPKALGAWWIRFSWCRQRMKVIYEAIPAQ